MGNQKETSVVLGLQQLEGTDAYQDQSFPRRPRTGGNVSFLKLSHLICILRQSAK